VERWALKDRGGGWLFVVPRGTNRRSKGRFGRFAGERTDFWPESSNYQRFSQRFTFRGFGGFFSDFRRSIFDDYFAAIRFVLSYLNSNSRSFLLREKSSQFL
jgi:hypothetical protein